LYSRSAQLLYELVLYPARTRPFSRDKVSLRKFRALRTEPGFSWDLSNIIDTLKIYSPLTHKKR
jgi:hypothetical protein